MVELWPGVADCCKLQPVRRLFGTLFPFEEWLGFVPVFLTTAFFEASEPIEGAFLPLLIMTIFNEETFSLKSGLQKGPRKLKIKNLQ